MIKSWYAIGGALLTDKPVEGLTEDLMASGSLTRKQNKEVTDFYGGRYIIAESMSESAARKISDALGLDYQGKKNPS